MVAPPNPPSGTPRYYAGIGSRETPESSRRLITEIAQTLEVQGYTLRSGGAPGADTFFEQAVSRAQIFLPWAGFNDSQHTQFVSPTDAAIDLAREEVYKFAERKQSVQMLLARNMHQVLGPDLDSPVDFVVCWTPQGRLMGGTAHAIRLAYAHKIIVYNLARPRERDALLNRIGLSKQLHLF